MSDESLVTTRRPDRRRARHEATKREIVDAAWAMVRAEGLTGLSLRALARAVDMEPQSLYTYFASKHAVYDALFADGNRELLARLHRIDFSPDLRTALTQMARLFIEFSAEDQARHQLLFMRTIPGFEPTPASYAPAVEVVAAGKARFEEEGLRTDVDFDLWTAIVAGLASQQLANDPGGDRYLCLIDDAIAMFVDHLER